MAKIMIGDELTRQLDAQVQSETSVQFQTREGERSKRRERKYT